MEIPGIPVLAHREATLLSGCICEEVSISRRGSVTDGMCVSPQSSYVRVLTHMMVFGAGALGGN